MPQHVSPFPEGFLGVELHYADAWHDITPDVDQEGVKIHHGSTSESWSSDPSSLEFTVWNGDGKYSPRNPESALYGQIGRNTPVRSSLALGAPFIDLPGGESSRVESSSIDPETGDLELIWWGYRDDWTIDTELMSRATVNDFGWILVTEVSSAGYHLPKLYWSEDGDHTNTRWVSGYSIPEHAGEIAIRCTMDVDDGNGGFVVQFFYGPTMYGPWTETPAVRVNGTTSVHQSAAAFTVGKNSLSSWDAAPAHVYGWRASGDNGITTEFDAATDTLTGWTMVDAQHTNRRTVATCEVSEWPMEWGRKGAQSVLSEVEAAGVSRRLGQGAQLLRSPLYRALSDLGPETVGYWPMEEGRDATTFGPAIGARNAQIDGEPLPGRYEDFAGSYPLPNVGTSRVRLFPDVYSPVGDCQVRWVGKMNYSSIPVGEEEDFVHIFLTGKLARLEIRLASFGYKAYAFDDEGNSRGFFQFAADLTTNHRFSVELWQTGNDAEFKFARIGAGETIGFAGSVNVLDIGPVGRITQVVFNPERYDWSDTVIGHVTVENEVTSLYDVSGPLLVGYAGETAIDRVGRLAQNNGVGMTRRGETVTNTPMGGQENATFLDLVESARIANDALVHDDPTGIAMRFRSNASLYDQPGIVIPYSDNLIIPFQTLDDDALTRNRVTIQRRNGADFTIQESDGPLSVQAPPNGVGLYDEGLELNLATDFQPEDHARWRLHVGTWDEGRYPRLGVDLANPVLLADPVLTRKLLSITPGDRLVITDPPPWLPPFDVDVLVTGVQIDVEPLHVRLTWSCVPAGPYHAARWDTDHRWSSDDTTLTAAADATQSGVVVASAGGDVWAADDGDYMIEIGGEHMLVTGVEPLENRIPNPSFEGPGGFRAVGDCSVGAGEWTLGGGMPTSGTNVGAVTMGSAPGTATGLWVDVDGEVTGGQKISVALDLRGSSSTQIPRARILIAAWDDTDTQIMDSRSGYHVIAGQPVQRATHAATLPAGAVRAAVLLIGAGETTDTPPAAASLITDSWTVFVRDGSLAGTETIAQWAGYFPDKAYYLTVDRSQNGVEISHDAGEKVNLAAPSYYGRFS